MEQKSPEIKELLGVLRKHEPLVAMLAPSFPIVFSYPQIVGKLKRLGFKYVVEVGRGAQETNRQLLKLLKKDSRSRYITSPCPSVVRLIRWQFPELKSFLAPTDSPIIATAKLVREQYPGFRPVFFGPCLVKKLEVREDHPELNILVLTFSELAYIFKELMISDQLGDKEAVFDLNAGETRLYPISGGLAASSGLNKLLTDEEHDVVSGLKLVTESLKDFPNSKLRVLDILFCEGGCIAGPGISSTLTLTQRRQKIIQYWLQLNKTSKED